MKKRGIFITFEGAEGSGKSTQIRRAADYLTARGRRVLVLREPGGTRISEAIRRILLNPSFREMAQETELLLYLAARAQLVHEKIMPALAKGQAVICDRYEDSTFAYQGYGRNISLSMIRALSRFARGGLRPHLTFLLDIDPVKGMHRGGRNDRIEKEAYAFHRRVRQGFLALAKKEKKRFIVLNALTGKGMLARKIREILDHELR